jgi:hypothetical protein
VHVPTRRFREPQRDLEKGRRVVDVELEGAGEVDHDADHLPVRCLAVDDVFHRVVLVRDVLVRDPERGKNLSDADTKTWDERGDRRRRYDDGLERLLADAEDESCARGT